MAIVEGGLSWDSLGSGGGTKREYLNSDRVISPLVVGRLSELKSLLSPNALRVMLHFSMDLTLYLAQFRRVSTRLLWGREGFGNQ